MSTAAPSELPPLPEGDVARRRRPPAWGIVLFLALLGGLVVVNQMVATGGTPIRWVENDLEAAVRRAATEKKPRIFLYLYEPNDPTHTRNERNVFSQRWARDPLENAVCCRIALRPGDIQRVTFRYNNTPLFLLLDEKGKPLGGRTEGAVDEREFMTYIGRPIYDVLKRGP